MKLGTVLAVVLQSSCLFIIFQPPRKDTEPSNLVEIWVALDSELPKLAPKKATKYWS